MKPMKVKKSPQGKTLPMAPKPEDSLTDAGQEVLVASKLTTMDPKWEQVESNVLLLRGVMAWGDDLVKTAEEVNRWRRSGTAVGDSDPMRTSSSTFVTTELSPRFKVFEDLFQGVVGLVINHWHKENPFAMSGPLGQVKQDQAPYELLRYTKGQHYGLHVDRGPYFSRRIAERQVSIVAFPVHGFEGGELRFPRQRLTIHPEPGLVVSFPSDASYPHESLKVHEGTKYSLVTWLF